ncbi:MAG: S-layer homology domain-containing protein [Oscillospiraceae bacterium]
MKRTKRWLAGLLCAVLLVSLLPTAALADESTQEHWAADAVDTLNGIYQTSVFQTNDNPMDLSAANSVLTAMGCTSEKLPSSGSFTRGVACEVLAEVFDLPIGSSAIQYLYDKNIINGYADGSLGETDSISYAQFAVITYRVLNSVGGGQGSSILSLKPGTKEYFSWMYLAARAAVQFDASATAGTIDSDTWNHWISQLMRAGDYGIPADAKPSGTFSPACPDTSTTKLSAAMQMVDAYIQAGGSPYIFSDVAPSEWCYDGIMYLFDRGIISGYGNGTFGLNDVTTRSIFALILFKAKGQTPTAADYSGLLAEAQTFATQNGYMPDSMDTDWWNGNITRAEAIVGFVKAFAGNEAASANTDILDRFSDKTGISEGAEKYIAYAVSIGLVNGTANGELDLSGTTTRGMAGVLLYRTLIGVDTTKMQDYQENITYALDTQGGAGE